MNLDWSSTRIKPLSAGLKRGIAAILKVYTDKASPDEGYALISSPVGIRVVNFGLVEDQKQFRDLVKKAAVLTDDVHASYFYSDGNLVSNDWTKEANGENYISRISASGRSDLLGWARNSLAPKIQRINRDFSKKFGWGEPGSIRFSASEERLSDGRTASTEGRFTAASRRVEQALGQEPGSVKEVPIKPDTALSRCIEKFVKGVLGKTVVMVNTEGATTHFDGMILTDDANTIYLDQNASKPHMVLLGHEILHVMRQDNEQLYQDLKASRIRYLLLLS